MLSFSATLRRDTSMLWYCQRRFRRAAKVTNVDRALEYFDTALPPVYGSRWPSIRLALLSKQKYVAVLNNFADHEPIIEELHDLGAMDIKHKYTSMAESMKTVEATKMKLSETKECVSQDQDDQEDAKPVRPSLIKLDDDELAARANRAPLDRYPEEYRHRALAQEWCCPPRLEDVLNRDFQGLEHWIEETDVFVDTVQGDEEIGLKREVQKVPFSLPSMLKIFSFGKGDITTFPKPKLDPHMKVLTHYMMDGASLLPVLALDLQPGERVLDLCAAPGGKTLLALQTMLPGLMVCNDLTDGRLRRLKSVLKQYIPSNCSQIQDSIVLTERNGCIPWEREAFDKVLVDAPCLTDRHVLKESDNSIFYPKRAKERLKLPELQSELLVSALHMVRPGGSVVYSTCTLSPLQNDGVVQMALSRIWQETTIDCCVVDLTPAMRPLSFLYRLGSNLGLRYGQILLPSLLANFGPMYVAKIKRLK
ncbi:5-methylcytosine rRNA methyltransferase NSUN4 [Chionoecetes opilio]|uniref:NOL1/NOP2/Sun domain family member 4 n=1 Tax=Chionoecetes opilio TaxID=41210 RepID=A0A8J4XZY4_CHIOP|nr:5-methylcytosine rRNA methyltransferase NSUN4 [Chionoecetes opilio]